MKTKTIILLACLLGSVFLGHANAGPEQETRYLAFQIFTYGPNPIIPTMGEGKNPQPAKFPDKAVLRDYIGDIKRRIGTVGDPQTRLAVVLGHLSFDHGEAETIKFIELGFELALETDVAVGFHIDDSMFWARRKDLWSNPKNVEAMDWDGTPCTGRSLLWGKEPSVAPPQMCFNSKVIQREVQQRAALIGKAIQAGMSRLQQLKRPELFAGLIAGSETQIGQDFKTGKYTRAHQELEILNNRNLSAELRSSEQLFAGKTPEPDAREYISAIARCSTGASAANTRRRTWTSSGRRRRGIHRTMDDRTRRGRCLPAENLLPHLLPLAPRLRRRR